MLRVHADVLREEEVASFYLRIISPASISARKRIETGKKEKQKQNNFFYREMQKRQTSSAMFFHDVFSLRDRKERRTTTILFRDMIWTPHNS